MASLKREPRPASIVLLRIVVVEPLADVRWALQSGRSDLRAPTRQSRQSLCFEVPVAVAGAGRGMPRFSGPAVQGTPERRSVYINSGQRAGQAASPWDRRAKVLLGGISWAMIRAAQAQRSGRLEARFNGRARDGGPACATVPLLGAGWHVR